MSAMPNENDENVVKHGEIVPGVKSAERYEYYPFGKDYPYSVTYREAYGLVGGAYEIWMPYVFDYETKTATQYGCFYTDRGGEKMVSSGSIQYVYNENGTELTVSFFTDAGYDDFYKVQEHYIWHKDNEKYLVELIYNIVGENQVVLDSIYTCQY